MMRLPRGKEVKSGIDLMQVDLLTALRTLGQGKFSGYLRFSLQAAATLMLFRNGRLAVAHYGDQQRSLLQVVALEKTFQAVRRQGGHLDIYRLEEDLAALLPMVIGGTSLLRGAPVGKVDIRAVLERMAREKRTGSLRVYTASRTALIFYRQGRPLGFFHDDCPALTTAADPSLSVAREQDARLDVLVPAKGLPGEPVDLMEDAETLLS